MADWDASCAKWRAVLATLPRSPKLPPYLLSTVRRFEEANGIELPVALATYLVTVSRMYPPEGHELTTSLLADTEIRAHPELGTNSAAGPRICGYIFGPADHPLRHALSHDPECLNLDATVLDHWLSTTVREEERPVAVLSHLAAPSVDTSIFTEFCFTIEDAFAAAGEICCRSCSGDVSGGVRLYRAKVGEHMPRTVDVSSHAGFCAQTRQKNVGMGLLYDEDQRPDGMFELCGWGVDMCDSVVLTGDYRGAVFTSNALVIDNFSYAALFPDLHAHYEGLHAVIGGVHRSHARLYLPHAAECAHSASDAKYLESNYYGIGTP